MSAAVRVFDVELTARGGGFAIPCRSAPADC